jgi:hypothetical protein
VADAIFLVSGPGSQAYTAIGAMRFVCLYRYVLTGHLIQGVKAPGGGAAEMLRFISYSVQF